jgi:hypothetical protein
MLTSQRHVAVRLLASEAATHGHASHAHDTTYGDHDPHKSLAETLKERHATLNDMPVPAGSWQEYHKKMNTGYNLVLALGALSVVATFFIMRATGTLYMHGAPDYKKLKINVD